MLGFVKQLIGLAIKRGERGGAVEHRAADADPKVGIIAFWCKGELADAGADAFGNDQRMAARNAEQEHAKLFTADAPHQIVRTHTGPDGVSNGPQRLIALIMAEMIIDRLEIVGIDDQKRSLRGIAARPGQMDW